MLGFMSPESLRQTVETGEVVFFSRSRQRLWKKGEASGHVLKVTEIRVHGNATIADDVVCAYAPDYFQAVGLWYERFDQTTDDEVITLLHS